MDMEGHRYIGRHNWCNRLVSISTLQVFFILPRLVFQVSLNYNLRRDFRLEGDSYAHFKAMLISLSLHLILLMFELLACDRLTSGRHLWVLVFIPLIFGSVASVGACVWSVKHDRSFELELFLAVNALQFVFLPLKLDKFVAWSWEVVFVPLWIVLCLSLVGVLYSIIFCGILMRTPEVSQQQKKSAINSAVGNSTTVLPILVYQVLLADKLDEDLDWPFIAVSSPLLVALFTLIILSFSAKGGNKCKYKCALFFLFLNIHRFS